MIMNELFWKTNGPDLPLAEQEYYELALEEPPNLWGTVYVVRRTHYEWDEAQGQMIPSDHIIDRIKTLEESKARYEAHRQILADLRFTHSDMDPIL